MTSLLGLGSDPGFLLAALAVAAARTVGLALPVAFAIGVIAGGIFDGPRPAAWLGLFLVAAPAESPDRRWVAVVGTACLAIGAGATALGALGATVLAGVAPVRDVEPGDRVAAALATLGLWATVPDTEIARAVVGALLVAALLGGVRLQLVLAALIWAGVRGVRGRPWVLSMALLQLGALLIEGPIAVRIGLLFGAVGLSVAITQTI